MTAPNTYKVLLVDGNENWLKLLKAVQNAEYEVVTASDGVEALDILLKDKIDLVVSDILMPNMDGYHLSYKIRTNEKIKNTPIIIYSALSAAQSEEQVAKDMGANRYVRKTTKVDVLSGVIKEILAEPLKYPHKVPIVSDLAEPMQQYNKKLVANLKESYLELEEIRLKLEYSESRLKQAQAIGGMGSWELNFETNTAFWSDELCRIYGLEPGENLQAPDAFLSFVYPDDLAYVSRIVNESHDTLQDTSFYHHIIRKDGEVRYVRTERRYEFDAHGKAKGLYGISQDITDSKKVEEELRKSEASLRSIFDNTNVGFLLMDTGYNVIARNVMAEKWSKTLLQGHLTRGTNLRDMLAPAQLEAFDNMMAAPHQGTQISYEANYPDADGALNWFQVSAKPVVESSGQVTGICLAINNITERRAAERVIKMLNETLEERVQERTAELSEANKALEAFSYSVSHDLRAPVRAVISFSKIIEHDYTAKLDPEIRELFGYINENGKRMGVIIDDLLKLARYGKQKLKYEPVDLAQLVKGVWSNIGRSKPHAARLELAELPIVQADMSMMEQVVINLLSNAIKYSSKKDKPVVLVWSERHKESITFYFKDNGAGFDMANYDRLFGAFQRLHGMSEFEGTGVGLMLVKSIIEKHNGTVGAEGKVGEGATFYFTLPLL